MMKDYYKIIGISRDADVDLIRRAYRKEIWRVHPDVSSAPDRDRFLEIQEAYDVLSDPEKRRYHNEDLARAERRGEPVTRPAVDSRRQRPRSVFSEPVSISRGFSTFSHPHAAFLERFFQNFSDLSRSKADRQEGLTAELILSPEEATTGGRLPIQVPVWIKCRRCGGAGSEWGYICSRCLGQGMIRAEENVVINIPARVRSGTVYEVPLGHLGIHNFYLRVFIRIGEP